MRERRGTRLLSQACAALLALGLTSLVLVAIGAPPFAAYASMIRGAIGSWSVAGDVLVAWVPLVLCASGLLVTFAAGLWNIGIEGQITFGAIAATWALRSWQGADPRLALALAILAGAAGGCLCAALVGGLRTFGGVSEIFGGLGLNYVATALNLWLIFGPWKRPGVASMSGTVPFDPGLWLPTLSERSRLAPIALLLALGAIVLVFVLMRGTYLGLRLRAVGRNPGAASLLGISVWRHTLAAFALCGALAGVAGAVQVTGVYHRLIPAISSGYGYLGLLVAMLSGYGALRAAPIALFFAALNVGAIQLPIALKLDSSLAGVLQGSLVLFFVLGEGVRARLACGGASRS